MEGIVIATLDDDRHFVFFRSSREQIELINCHAKDWEEDGLDQGIITCRTLGLDEAAGETNGDASDELEVANINGEVEVLAEPRMVATAAALEAVVDVGKL
ncbi:hypothetical protein Adt_29978 [Abeliophyllum distichum]|uniref:Uncharacterized protein n=1 Tax=Abeliophyllum distichum TaxID=126358 RepID=A0ABD1R9Y0_9LAMI